LVLLKTNNLSTFHFLLALSRDAAVTLSLLYLNTKRFNFSMLILEHPRSTMKLAPSPLPFFSYCLIMCLILLASCTQQPIPAPNDTSEQPALFTDADINNAELHLATRLGTLQGIDGGDAGESKLLSDLETLEHGFTAQAVLPNTRGFVYYSQENSLSTTQPFSIFRHDQNSDVTVRIYGGRREIQSVAGSLDGNTVFVSMRETTSPTSDFEIFRLRISPARTQQLTSNSSDDTNVSASNTALRAVWEQDVAGKATIFLRTYDDLNTNSNFSEVSLGRSEAQLQPSLSANGQFIVLVRALANGQSQVVRFDTQRGSYLTVVTSSAGLEHPSISSAGTKVLFLQNGSSGNDLVRLRDLSAATTQTVASAAILEHPFLTADGRHFTFGLFQGSVLSVFVKDIVSGQQARLTTPTSPTNHKGMSWAVPFAGDTRLTSPSTLTSNSRFGSAVAASVDTLAVGAPDELGLVGGSSTSVLGAVYLYQRDLSGQWFLSQRLVHPQPVFSTLFGTSIAISGNTMVIGTNEGVDLNGDGRLEFGVGAAFIYQRVPGTSNWILVKSVVDPDRNGGDAFGSSVSVLGTTVLVGASGDEGTGSVSIFEKGLGGSNNWGFVKKIKGSDSVTGDFFGEAMASSGDTVVIGAGGHDLQQGAAYIFERNQGGANNWGEVKKLVASDGKAGNAGSGFNSQSRALAVAISGSTVVMGTSNEARDVNGVPGDEFAVGSAYVFERNQGGNNNWGEVKKLISSSASGFDFYGVSAAISDDLIMIGAPRASNNTTRQAGSVFVYRRNQGGSNNWGEIAELIPGDGNSRRPDNFGIAIAMTGNASIIGASAKDSLVGAAYVFE
jgi:Tol biopolymer transport system component